MQQNTGREWDGQVHLRVLDGAEALELVWLQDRRQQVVHAGRPAAAGRDRQVHLGLRCGTKEMIMRRWVRAGAHHLFGCAGFDIKRRQTVVLKTVVVC